MIYLIFFLSIIIHELGHIISCNILHIKFGRVNFGIFGFSNREVRFSNLNKSQKIFILASGSFFNFILAIISVKLPFSFNDKICFTNLLLAMFNLLPIIPLDGGNILICILNYKFSIKKSIKISLIISKIFLVILIFAYCILILFLKNLFLLGIIVYLWYLYLKEESKFELYFRIENKFKILSKI